ncbi:MAG: hypothetical protein QM500_15275 [Methylococcales bacterium]
MKKLTKTLVAATLALGAASANASILTANDMSGEAWLSVYDKTSRQTFTLDLGVAGVTAGYLFNQRATTNSFLNVDLSQFADWNTFKSTANLATTQYVVVATGQTPDFSQQVMFTGAGATKFNGLGLDVIAAAKSNIDVHVKNINSDSSASQDPSVNDTTLAVDKDGIHIGQHNEGAGSGLLWGGVAYNPNGKYGSAVDFQLANIDFATFTAQQTQFSMQFKLAGDTLSTVPVPAAVWLFASAILGLAGVSRKRKAV